MRNKKQGVSLIVLVITIIVMIILASAVMISLSNTGILDKANEVVDATNLKTAQQIAALAWSEAYMDNMDETDETLKLKNIKDAVEKALKDNGIDTTRYVPTVTITGVTVAEKGQGGNTKPVPEEWKASVREVTEDDVPIPIGFVKSPYPNEGEKDTGLVIYALKPEEIGKTTTITDDYQTALETRNQFVWVPVDSEDFEDLFVRSNNGWKDLSGNTLSPTLGTNYWELVLDATNMPSQTLNTTNYVSVDTLKEATAMYNSVKKYGGFYIARYEVGADATEGNAEDGYIGRGNMSVTMAKYPYNGVSWGESMSEEGEDGAVALSRSFYPSEGTNPYGVVSTLTYGVQWDRTLAWWKELDSTFDVTNATDYGVYYDTEIDEDYLNDGAEYSFYDNEDTMLWEEYVPATGRDAETESWLMTTGAYKKANVYNIYDLAGNLGEWTMEGYSANDRLIRGAVFYISGDSGNPASRGSYGRPDVRGRHHRFPPFTLYQVALVTCVAGAVVRVISDA